VLGLCVDNIVSVSDKFIVVVFDDGDIGEESDTVDSTFEVLVVGLNVVLSVVKVGFSEIN
jgi:hypothetical protein